MQNVIITQVQRYVTDAFDARVVLSFFVGEKDAVAPFKLTRFYVFTLLYLRASVDVEQRIRALIKNVLYQGGTVEFLHGKIRK